MLTYMRKSCLDCLSKSGTSLNEGLRTKIASYINDAFHENDLEGLSKLIESNVSDETAKILEDRFEKRLEFGTAGLRGKMSFGFNAINSVTIAQTTQGVACFLVETFGASACLSRGVLIGFDGRHNSARFAQLVAKILSFKKIKVYLCSKYLATPLVAYGVKALNCFFGIQITASHNPKNDNGYKVYNERGCQIISPMDSEIADRINENLVLWTDCYAADLAIASTDPYDLLLNSYLENTMTSVVDSQMVLSVRFPKLVYTAMHGVGKEFISKLVEKMGCEGNVKYFEKQASPDPEFPTLSFPNPEEKGSLALAMEEAVANEAKIVLATDPDADRFGCAELQENGKWKVFSGDELGIIFGSWALKFHLAKYPSVQRKDLLFLCSAVSSGMLKKMCEVEGCMFLETMTGFKWLMNIALDQIEARNAHFCLAYEEAIGFALNINVPDKDGISATAVFIQIINEVYASGMKVYDRLKALQKQYGHFQTNNGYFLYKNPSKIKLAFDSFRRHGDYVKAIEEFKVTRIRDITTGYDSDPLEKAKSSFPLTPLSQMITIYFEQGVRITLRGSGTEPKLKWYAEMSGNDPDKVKTTLERVVKLTTEAFKES